MTYSEQNIALVERFGDLERLCGQIYGTPHGVSSYIDDMIRVSREGRCFVYGWDRDLQRLKETRHKRNQLSHGEVSFSTRYAEEDDAAFLTDFRERIMQRTDPLAQLHSQKQEAFQQRKPAFHPETSSPRMEKTENRSFPQNPSGRRGCYGCLTVLLLFALLAIGAVFAIVFLFF